MRSPFAVVDSVVVVGGGDVVFVVESRGVIARAKPRHDGMI